MSITYEVAREDYIIELDADIQQSEVEQAFEDYYSGNFDDAEQIGFFSNLDEAREFADNAFNRSKITVKKTPAGKLEVRSSRICIDKVEESDGGCDASYESEEVLAYEPCDIMDAIRSLLVSDNKNTKIAGIKEINKRLNDGLARTPEELTKCEQWLTEYLTANQLSLRELDDLCFKDSVWVFEQIFAEVRSTPQKPFEVTREGYRIYYHQGISQREAERLSREFNHEAYDAVDFLGVFETLDEARRFAEAVAEKEDLSIRNDVVVEQPYSDSTFTHCITFTLIQVAENDFTDNGEQDGCEYWDYHGATPEELVNVMCPTKVDDEVEE